ncbi:hypothetical protein JCM3770_001891 [Rhodotorula araucariae]
MEALILYVTLAGAFVALVCSAYTTLRTLLPLLPSHPLDRRAKTGALIPPQEKRAPRLKSAQRFTAYLAAVDILAATVLVVEVALAVGTRAQLGGSRGGASRLYLATTARPTLLLVVALLSYTNVVLGRSITLGRADWIVWLPAIGIYVSGAGLAAMPSVGSRKVWIGLCAWLTAVTFVVVLCFGRLLIAILRVRRITQHERTFSSHPVSFGDVHHETTLPTFHPNFSGLSASFVNSIGRSASTLHLPPLPDNRLCSSNARPSLGYAPSRASTEEREFDHARDFRSPTPGSAHLLLARSTMSTPASLSDRLTPHLGPRLADLEDDHEVIDLDGRRSGESATPRSRASVGSIASRASTYAVPGGFVGASNGRDVLVKKAWGRSTPPGTGHSPKVELSSREARGALVRIGGHLLCSLLSYAFVSPFVFTRLLSPTSSAPLATTILLVLGVCQPSVILAWQCWSSEGFWFRRPTQPVLTSSTALAFEKVDDLTVAGPDTDTDVCERWHSRASTYKTWRTGPPGIQPDGEDCEPSPRGTIGRALSMVATHPKLQVLPTTTVEPASVTSGFVKSASTGHARLRSLKLSKATIGSFGELGRAARPRAGSSVSRKTVGGHEHARRRASMPVLASDQAIAMSLLRSRKAAADAPTVSGQARVPGGPGEFALRSTLDALDERADSYTPPPPVVPVDFHFSTRELSLSPTSSTFPATALPPLPSAHPPVPDHTIDYLSAHLLPQLVPSIKLGANVKVGPQDAPLPRRRSSTNEAPAPPASASLSARSFAGFAGASFASRRSRKNRGLSLPGLAVPPLSTVGAHAFDETWLAVDEGTATRDADLSPHRRRTPDAVRAVLGRVRHEEAADLTHAGEESRHSRRGRGSSPQQWDEVEAAAREVEAAVDALGSSGSSAARAVPSTSHARSASSGTRLVTTFEWDEGAAEVLQEVGALADASASEDDDKDAAAAALEAHQRARRVPASISPASSTFGSLRALSPRSRTPQSFQRQSVDGSVVLRGSLVASDDEADVMTGTVQCATVHPVTRDSDLFVAEHAGWVVRPTHIPAGSLNSMRSFASTDSSLVTSDGFRDILSGNAWKTHADYSGPSADEQQSLGTRRPLPIPPVLQRSLPLLVLGEGGSAGALSLGSVSKREMQHGSHTGRATSERDRSSRVLNNENLDAGGAATATSRRRPLPAIPGPAVHAGMHRFR